MAENTGEKLILYVAPRTPTEEKLAAIWADLLGYERIGIHDDFFEHGGHSLSATQLLSRVREIFSVELPIRVFFTSISGRITVAELARLVADAQLEQEDELDILSALESLEDMSDEELEKYLRENN